MKDKLNNALDNIDERFIEEAARAGRTAGGAPRWLKFAAIPAVAAAAVVCVFAVRGSIQKPGVDLITQSAGGPRSAARADQGSRREYLLQRSISPAAVCRRGTGGFHRLGQLRVYLQL